MIGAYRGCVRVLAAAAILLAVPSQRSYAGAMITGNGQVLNVNEGSSANLIFGVKNTGPGPLIVNSYDNNLQSRLIGGDATDDFTATFTGPDSGTVIPANFTVSLIYNIATPKTTGEAEDLVSGEWFFVPPLDGKNQVTLTDNTPTPPMKIVLDVTGATINVLDAAVPEPASLTLLGIGMIGVIVQMWRMKGSNPTKEQKRS